MFRLSIIKLVFLSIVFCGLAVAPELRAELKVFDDNARKYKVRNADPDEVDEEEKKRYFNEVEFTTKTSEKIINGKKMVVFERESLSKEGGRREFEFMYDAKTLIIFGSEEHLYSRNGKLLKVETKYYENHFVDYGKITFSPRMFPFIVQLIDFKVGDVIDCQMVFKPEFKPWAVYLTIEAIETITVPVGTFECAKIRVEYDTEDVPGLFKILPQFLLKHFISDYYIWVEMDEPHNMVRFQGKIHGFASPEKVEELVEVIKN